MTGGSFSEAPGSAPFLVQFLTATGWETDREVESENMAIVHFFAIGKAKVWTGHVRIIHGERVVKSTLPNIVVRDGPRAGRLCSTWLDIRFFKPHAYKPCPK